MASSSSSRCKVHIAAAAAFTAVLTTIRLLLSYNHLLLLLLLLLLWGYAAGSTFRQLQQPASYALWLLAVMCNPQDGCTAAFQHGLNPAL
jgi:hypothetical protein